MERQALTKPNIGTNWKASKPRGAKHILMVTFPGKLVPMQAANFYAEVMDEREVTDMLLMVLTYDSTE
jgi:hypothetical protein